MADLSELGPWRPGESRFVACERHASALERMDFDAAWERAWMCSRCEADYEGRPR